MHDRFASGLRWSLIVILALTAAAKFVSSTGRASILTLPDPLLGVSTRVVLIVVGMLELLAVVLLLSKPRTSRSFLFAAWLGCNFILYRLAAGVLHPGRPCPCLGTVTERLHISSFAANRFLWVSAGYLVVVSLTLTWRSVRAQPK